MDMGTYGLDSPKFLVDNVIDNLVSNYNKLNQETKLMGVIINGDFPRHHSALKGSQSNE